MHVLGFVLNVHKLSHMDLHNTSCMVMTFATLAKIYFAGLQKKLSIIDNIKMKRERERERESWQEVKRTCLYHGGW